MLFMIFLSVCDILTFFMWRLQIGLPVSFVSSFYIIHMILWLWLILLLLLLWLSRHSYYYCEKSQSHCLSWPYNVCSEQHPLSSDPRFDWGATEEGSLSQDGQTCNRWSMYRAYDNHLLQISLTEYLIQINCTKYVRWDETYFCVVIVCFCV